MISREFLFLAALFQDCKSLFKHSSLKIDHDLGRRPQEKDDAAEDAGAHGGPAGRDDAVRDATAADGGGAEGDKGPHARAEGEGAAGEPAHGEAGSGDEPRDIPGAALPERPIKDKNHGRPARHDTEEDDRDAGIQDKEEMIMADTGPQSIDEVEIGEIG